MKRRAGICLLSALLCFLAAGCGGKENEEFTENIYHAYYIREDGSQLMETEYTPKAAGETETLIEEYTESLKEEPEEDGEPVLPEGITVEDTQLHEGILDVDLNAAYHTLTPEREILARCGIVRTFVQIPGVSRVKMLVEGEPLTDSYGKEIGSMTAESFVENSGKEINTYQKITVTLYFAGQDGKTLLPEERTFYYSTSVPLEREVLKQLAKGPEKAGRYAVLPAETNILSVAVSEGICYVNFDSSFQNTVPNVEAKTTIYAIVNTLAGACKAEDVQFSINGESKVKFRDEVPLDRLYQWDGSCIEKEGEDD